MVKPEEVPLDCGLMEAQWVETTYPQRDGTYRLTLHETVKAPWRDSCFPNWLFVACIARRAYETERACHFAEPLLKHLQALLVSQDPQRTSPELRQVDAWLDEQRKRS